MTENSQKSDEKTTPKGENPPKEKVAAKLAESGKTFEGKGKEKRG